MDLPSVLGGLAQGFVDFGKSAVDLFGTGGAAFADLIQGTGTKNQDDFRKWLYQTDSVKDAAAKGLGTALNGAQTISDYVIPGGISKSVLFNAGQGALGGLADEFKTYGENYDLGRAGQRALVSAGAAGAGTGLANALKKSGSGLLQSGLAQGASRGALSGAINQGGYTAIDGGDIAQSALQGAGMGALLGGATGAVQDFMPRKQQYMPLTEEEKTARIANAKQMLETATTPERRAELQAQINRLGGTLENTLAADDMAVNAAMEPEGFTYDYDGSDMAAVQRAYNLATQDQAKLDGMLKEISDTLGTEFSSAGQKSMESMLNKVERKVRSGRDYTVSSMKDHTRGKVMMNNFSEIPQVLQELDRRGIPYDTEVVTNDWGYKGYHITFRNPDGISSEIQLTTSDHWPAKLESDAIYDKWRNFNLGTASKTERQRYNDAMAKSQALWAKVDFNDFDKAVQSLSDTGRASRSVAPVTSKLGLTQEPSLYTKTPSPSESANMSPSSVTRTFSGTGFDKSPNINKTPFNDIIPQSTSITQDLARTLAGQDMAVNNVPEVMASAADAPQYKRIYHGTNKTFTDFDESLPSIWFTDNKDDIANTGLSNNGGKLNIMERDLPSNLKLADWDLADNLTKQQLIERGYDGIAYEGSGDSGKDTYYEIFNPNKTLKKVDPGVKASYGGYGSGNAYSTSVNRIGSKDVAPIDASTLPEGWGELKSFLRDYDTLVEKEIGKPRGKITKQDLVKALEEYGYDTDGTKDQMWRNLHTALVDNRIDDMYMNNAGTPAQIIDMYRQSPQLISPGRLSLDGNNRTARLDAEFSDRLGIGRSNTPMADTTVAVGAGAQGDYSNGALGTDPLWATGENGISTVAHERLHSMQNEGLNWNYDEEFRDAMSELRSELAPLYHSKEEINQYWNGRKPDYYHNYDEQEARMLQDYLERKNYTQRYMNGKRSYEYDEKIIKPFDKFFDKLRDLSKRGVALPALAGLVGGGAVLEQILNPKNDDKKKTNKRSA